MSVLDVKLIQEAPIFSKCLIGKKGPPKLKPFLVLAFSIHYLISAVAVLRNKSKF